MVYSKEWRVDPQIIVGLLVDRAGFPLQVGCWEGNRIPVVEAFQAAHGIEDLVIVADAGMLSAANLTALDEARLRFIVGARTTRAPRDLEAHFHWAGDVPADGQLIDTITLMRGLKTERDKSLKAEPVWDPVTHPGSWRAVWVYSKKRAARDNQTLTAQANRARAVIAGERRPKGMRFATVHAGGAILEKASLAVAHHLQKNTGISIKRVIRALKPLQEVNINLNGHQITTQPQIISNAASILKSLQPPGN